MAYGTVGVKWEVFVWVHVYDGGGTGVIDIFQSPMVISADNEIQKA